MFDLIRNLKKGGRGIIYITHRIPEVYAITDRVTVLRDGQVVASKATNEVSPEELIDMIAGRRLADELMHPVHGRAQGQGALKLEGVSVEGKLHDINLTIHSGEIFGLAGLVGSGRTELARCIFGADPKDAGTIQVNGAPLRSGNPPTRGGRNRLDTGGPPQAGARARDGRRTQFWPRQLSAIRAFRDLAASRTA